MLTDGSYHDVDSSEMAFKLAAALAYKDGLKNASPVLLEPIVKLKVAVPNGYLGDVMGDINKRRGRIVGTSAEGETAIVTAEVPLAEITKYTTDLRGFTQGKGRFSIEPLRYEEVPYQIAEKIIASRAE